MEEWWLVGKKKKSCWKEGFSYGFSMGFLGFFWFFYGFFLGGVERGISFRLFLWFSGVFDGFLMGFSRVF